MTILSSGDPDNPIKIQDYYRTSSIEEPKNSTLPDE